MVSAARTARSGSSSCDWGTPNTAITASPMNFSTVPPNAAAACDSSLYTSASSARRCSASTRIASSVEPARSANSTVASLRSSPPADAGVSGRPQLGQKRAPSGTALPHAGQVKPSAWCCACRR